MAGALQAEATLVAPSHPPEAQHLKTSSVGFAIWWIVLLLLHAVNLGYYGLAAILYHALLGSSVDYQLITYKIGISNQHYFKVSRIHWVIAVLHVLLMLAMIIGSLQARRLVFLPTLPPWVVRIWAKVPSIKTKIVVPPPPSQRRSSIASFASRLSSFSEQSMAVSSSVFGREGFFGVDGVYFDHLLLARELLETSLQLIQVYRMGYLLPRVWLIRFYVILLIANCWSVPLLHRYYGNRHVERRMMSLLCDAVLDMVSSIGVSVWIFATYVPQYNDPVYGFPTSNWLDDVWFTNVQQEFQMMLVVSWADMVSRLVFAVGLVQCMEAIKDMLTPPTEAKLPRDSARKVATAAGVRPSPSKDEDRREASRAEKDEATQEPPRVIGATKVVPGAVKPSKRHTSKWHRAVKFILEKIGPALFVVLGLAILIVHIISETRQPSSHIPCRLQLHPWFVSKPACSLVELDCHHLGGLSGSQESMKEAWNTYEFGAAARIIVRHCPQLELPSTLKQFHQLTSLKTYNSTITSWPMEHAFTATSHHKMCAFYAIRTNFTNGVLPPGVLSAQFPQGLVNFVTSVTNIQTLPDNLHELWPSGMTLIFEWTPLQVVPPTLTKINPYALSLAGSPIAIIPPEIFESPGLAALGLSQTKLQELPRVVANPSPTLYILWLRGTNVSTFWSWMEPSLRIAHSINRHSFNAYGTPFCAERNAIVAGNRTSFSIVTAEPGARDLASVMDVSTPEKLQYSTIAVSCASRVSFYFPLALQDKQSALRP
jgi:hypothetical protein